MPTIVTLTIGPSGKQYTSMTACVSANAKNLVTADEQHVYEFYTFAGGLNNNSFFGGYTDDATRNIVLTVAPSDAWDRIDPLSGFYFANISGSTTFRPTSTVQFLEVEIVCFSGAFNFSHANGGGFKSISDLAIKDSAGDALSSINCPLESILILDPGDDGIITNSATNKCTVINASNRGLLSVGGSTITNSFAFGSTGVDFSNQGGSGHSNNATEDATAAGTSPQINRTSADFADFAGDDFRTASGSALATAGSVDFIGYALEVSGGVTVTGATANYSYTGVNGLTDLTGEILITGNTANFAFNALSGVIDLTGEILVTGSTADFSYDSITGLVDLTAELVVTGQTANYSYNAITGNVEFTGEISVLGQTANYNYLALPGAIDLTGEIVISGATANYNYNPITGNVELGAVINITGQTANFSFSGVNGDVELAGEIIIQGQTATFNYNAISGGVVIGGGQKIGTVTAGFADNEISVQYKQDTITVNFGE